MTAGYGQASTEQYERVSAQRSPPYPALLRVHPQAFWFFPGCMNGRCEKVGLPDEEGWIRVHAIFDSIDHARTQVLGFGTHAEALEPEELKRTAIETAAAIIKFHRERVQAPDTAIPE